MAAAVKLGLGLELDLMLLELQVGLLVVTIEQLLVAKLESFSYSLRQVTVNLAQAVALDLPF